MQDVQEFRKESRVICQGDVELYPDGSNLEMRASLLDVSNNGFRAAHRCPELQPGHEVRFHHKFFVGRARVVWTSEVAGQTQSGFQIVRQ